MYWGPSTEKVIGEPLCGAGSHTAPTCLPPFFSYARSIAPRGCSGVVVTLGSPETTSVFVTTTPTLPLCPVFGMLSPLSAGWLRTESGVSPCGVDQTSSPRSRLIATICPYGGFTIGRPWTVAPNPPPPGGAAPRPPAAGGGVGGGGGVAGRAGRGASAASPSPPPTIARNVCPAVPIT